MENKGSERTSFNFEEEIYPRVYEASDSRKAVYILALLFMFGVFCLVIHGMSDESSVRVVPSFAFVLFFALALFTALLLDSFTEKTILYKDKIVRQSIFKKIEMNRDDITGIKLVALGRGATGRLLVNKNSTDRLFFLPDNIQEDAIWRTWMNVAPDLDVQAVQEVANDTTRNTELGTSVEERTQSVNSAISITQGLSYLVAIPFVMVLNNSAYALYAALIMQAIVLVNMYRYGAVSIKSIYNPKVGSRMALIFNSATLLFLLWRKMH